MAIGETNHPLLVGVESGELTPCEQGRDGCGIWATGQLTLTDRSATVILTGAGCEQCYVKVIEGDDIGVIAVQDTLGVSEDIRFMAEGNRADNLLAEKINGLTHAKPKD